MRRIVMLLLALGVATALLAAVQDTSSQSQTTQSQGQTQQPSSSTQSTQQSQGGTQADKHMNGKISNDGKTFTSDKGKSYSVDNPDALKGHEGQPVALIVRVDPDTNTVHVLTVAAPEQQ